MSWDSAKSAKVKKARVQDKVHLTRTEKIGVKAQGSNNKERLLIQIPSSTQNVRNRQEIVTESAHAHNQNQRALSWL